MRVDCKCLLGLAGCVTVLVSISLADNRQKEVSTLIEHAAQLSDIRGSNAPAFHLKAALTFYEGKGASEGTYTEFWSSGAQWRRETVVGSYHRIQVASGSKRWLLDNNKEIPFEAGTPETMLTAWKPPWDRWKNAKIAETSLHGLALRCVKADAYPPRKAALCFDKVTGLLIASVEPFQLQQRVADQRCEYGDYQTFGEKTFPRIVRCFDDGKLKLEMRVVELHMTNSLSAELFAPLDGAKETFNCQGIMKPPRPVSTPDPVPPRRENPEHPVELLVTVGKDGTPQDIKVVRSIDEAFDSAAMTTVRRWRFEPGRCDSEPVEVEVRVTIQFNIRW